MNQALKEAGTTDPHPQLQWLLTAARSQKSGQQEFIALRTNFNFFRSSLLSFMEKYDVILCPVSPFPAPPHSAIQRDEKLSVVSY